MIYWAITLLGCLSFFNYVISNNILYPPLLFSAIWLLNLIGLVLSGSTFYPVTTGALLIYIFGAIFFSMGGLYALYLSGNNLNKCSFSEGRILRVHKILDIILLFTIACLPVYIMKIAHFVTISDYYVLATLRKTSIEASTSSQRSFSIINNLVVVSTFVALAMHYENDGTTGRRWRSILAIIVAVLYGVFTGSKGWVLIFPTLAFLSFIVKKKVHFSTLALVASVTLGLFGAGLLMINFIYSDAGNPLKTLEIIAKTIQNYWLGSLVAFNRVIETPESIASTQSLNRFFLETANGFGASFDIPSLYPEYTQVSASGDNTNTYTIYFSYYKDFGWFGVILGMFGLGAGLSWVYRYSMQNYPIAVFVFATAAVGILLSFHAEHFMLALNYYVKLLVFYSFVYYVLTRKYCWKNTMNS